MIICLALPTPETQNLMQALHIIPCKLCVIIGLTKLHHSNVNNYFLIFCRKEKVIDKELKSDTEIAKIQGLLLPCSMMEYMSVVNGFETSRFMGQFHSKVLEDKIYFSVAYTPLE